MYSGGNDCTAVGVYSCGNYSTKLGIKPACGKRGVYSCGNYSTVVGITVQWWELSQLMMSVWWTVTVHTLVARCPCSGLLQYRLGVLSVVLTCGVGWVQALTGVCSSAGRACRSVCPDGILPTASGEAGVSGLKSLWPQSSGAF